MSLKEYNKKRNFDITKEPKGNKKEKSNNRYVIQYHEARAKHYDFRLEYNGVLLSWAVPKGLSMNPKDKRLAVMVEDHPVDYINFEGIIPKGNYGAGTVEIYDKGVYYPLIDVGKGLKEGQIKFILKGERYTGGFTLLKMKDDNWLIIKEKDSYSENKEMTKVTKLPFYECSVQLAKLETHVPKGKEWIFEIKYDGYRMVSYVEKGKVKILSRNNLDYTDKFKSICDSLKKIKKDSFIVDGEMVVFDNKGRSDYGLLQDGLKNKKENFCYVIFDLLSLNGEDLRKFPLIKRKEKLERLLFDVPSNLMFSSHVKEGEEILKFARENNLEGIVAKKEESVYAGKRNNDWLKIKCFNRQEFVIAGYTTSSKNELISALLLGYYDNKKLIYVGKVGTGLSEELKKELNASFDSYKSNKSFFINLDKGKNVVWLKPHFVCEVQYAEFTKDNILRQPSFIGLRKDKEAKKVVLER